MGVSRWQAVNNRKVVSVVVKVEVGLYQYSLARIGSYVTASQQTNMSRMEKQRYFEGGSEGQGCSGGEG